MRRLTSITLLRSLSIVVATAVLWVVFSNLLSDYRNTQMATGAYYFAALAGLTVLAGSSGRISLGHGALMAVGAYTASLLIAKEGWAVAPLSSRRRSTG